LVNRAGVVRYRQNVARNGTTHLPLDLAPLANFRVAGENRAMRSAIEEQHGTRRILPLSVLREQVLCRRW
jgi:hypothetical protein